MTPMKKKILLLLPLAVILVIAGLGIYKFNFTNDDIYYQGNSIQPESSHLFVGSWVEPNPINDKEVQGFKLNADGTASSINMETLKYKAWKIEPGKLLLIAESIGNGVSFTDTTTCEIVLVGSKTLDIKIHTNIRKYKKLDE